MVYQREGIWRSHTFLARVDRDAPFGDLLDHEAEEQRLLRCHSAGDRQVPGGVRSWLHRFISAAFPIGGPEKRRECWRVCDAKKQGNLKSIGVSNFGVRHLEEMPEQGVELPVLNQVGSPSRSTPWSRD